MKNILLLLAFFVQVAFLKGDPEFFHPVCWSRIKPMMGMDASMLTGKTWYVWGIKAWSIYYPGHCKRFTFNDDLTVDFQTLPLDEGAAMLVTAGTFALDETDPAVISLNIPALGDVYKTVLMDSDYESFALLYMCNDDAASVMTDTY